MTMPRPGQHTAQPRSTALDGEALARALAGGTGALEGQAEAINAINVFPVPDGDTGTNMSITMRSAAGAAQAQADREPRDVARAAADAALMGAKGNSGVILSQILAGFAAMEAGLRLDATQLAAALERGRDAGYRVVSEPREGTILTAIAEAARAARASAVGGGAAEDALEAAAEGARVATEHSPELLPVLKEAGVVDAGAQGLYVLLEGMVRALRGEPIAVDIAGGQIDAAWLAARRGLHDGDGHGFCTEFVLASPAIDAAAMRQALGGMGTSLLVTGSDGAVRIHIHTGEPERVFAYARTLGDVSHEKADDMAAQMDALAARSGGRAARAVAAVAVGAGEGIETLMRSLGATVVRGGQTMNPSAGEIAAAIDATGAENVIVLPDNKNVVLASQQAARACKARVVVVPARSVPAGIAALVAMNPEQTLDEIVAAMEQAAANIATAEITRAVRTTSVEGHAVREGQAIGIVDGKLTVVEDEPEEAARAAVGEMIGGREAPLVTLYYGEGADEAAAEALADAIRAAHGCEVEVVRGGQPHYPYLIGVE